MKVVVAGSSGSIGSALLPHLRAAGHEVIRLVRREPRTPDEVRWDPASGALDPALLAGAEAAVNLAGPGIGSKRWTTAYKREVKQARVEATETLAVALAALDPQPGVLVSGSAIGFYGDTGAAVVDESAPAGADYLAEIVQAWEHATAPAERAGIRVVHLRTGVVMSADGGLLDTPVPIFGLPIKLLPLFKLGLGGRLGSGQQWMSWVSMRDEVRAIQFALETASLSGPINVTAPEAVTNKGWTKALGKQLRRPTVLPVPAPVLRLAVGEFANLGALVSQRVQPRRLLDAGFEFELPTIESALAAELSGSR
ncbi:MAG: uncharacterized protein QOK42_1170 [Frankiaceae bacterium]|nr:uncharacterized protein [Frankiaceae bacterium]